VADVRGAAFTYAMGLVQDGKTPKAALDMSVHDLIEDNHITANVNGRSLYISQDDYKGTGAEFSRAISAAMSRIDPSRINLTDDNHRPLFPVLSLAGHGDTARQALSYQLANHTVPNINPDRKSFSLYYDDGGNHFQLRDTSGKPITMQISDLPTFSTGVVPSHSRIAHGWITNWPTVGRQTSKPLTTPASTGGATPPDDR